MLAAVLAAATATAGFCQPTTDGPPPAVVVDAWLAAWNRQDLPALKQLLAADALMKFTFDESATGQVWFDTILTPNTRVMTLAEVESRTVEGDVVSEVERIPPRYGTAPSWTVRYRVTGGCIVGIDMS